MATDNRQEKTDKLSRIRENQRKSRARKQEHVRDLEQQLALLKKQAQQKDIEHRLASQKLQGENRKLRQLLVSSGASDSVVENYLRTDEDPVVNRKVAVPALQRVANFESRCQNGGCVSPCSSGKQMDSCSAGELSKQSYPGNEPRKTPDPELSHASQVSLPSSAPDKAQSVCGCIADESWPTNDDILNTTLCAIAEELVNQYNTRGVDMTEIQKRLRAGFSRGLAEGEGCRVQNNILFEVLDEISSI